VNLSNLLRTSAFRLTLLYVVLFAASVLVVLGFIYWDTVSYLNEQTDERIKSEVSALRKQYDQFGLNGLRQSIVGRSEMLDDTDQLYALVAPNGSLMEGNIASWPPGLREHSGWLNASLPEQDDDGDAGINTARALAITLPGGYHLLVGRDLDEREDLHEHTVQVLVVAIGFSLILALTVGLIMSRATLRRIEAINRAGRAIMAGNLAQRIPIAGSGDEFDQLAKNLNAMLGQIQRLMEGMRQVTDNVAHDLRSPLNRLRTRLEVTLLAPRSADDYRIAIEQTLTDTEALLGTFNALLSIAQVESGADRGDWTSVDLTALMQDVAELYQPLAEDKDLRFTQQIAQGLRLHGNQHLLTQAIGNLLDNAIKYTPDGGAVQLRSRETRNGIEVSISDNGPGIPTAMRDKVFERFVRLEASRTTPGNGLGLSLVRAVAQLHGVKLELGDAYPGLKVSLNFPIHSRPSQALGLDKPSQKTVANCNNHT
jgi:signal transduction histidine kinase